MSHDRFSDLAVFVRAVESGSFSAAGRQLDLSASAVSKAISRLEERLGARLLHRTSRSLQLTYEGEVFIVGARRVLEAMDDAQRSLSELTAELSGRLRIYTLPSFGYTLVPFIAEFVRRFPRIKIDIQLGAERVDLVERNIDLAIRLGVLQDSAYFARKIGLTKHVICAAPAYLARRGTPATPAALKDHNCLNFSIRTHDIHWGLRAESALKPASVDGDITSNQAEMLHRLCVAGVGITELPYYVVERDIASGALVTLLDSDAQPEHDPIWAIYPHNQNPSPRTTAFIEFLRERIAASPGFLPPG
ncbi:LysR family transcriptional regulator [Variovorax boronicumulans]|uniref:LysR family transcriptional regulator n=1 Tax=Variovorax boronicumulans TaxID=436515 RepID=UPI001C58F650